MIQADKALLYTAKAIDVLEQVAQPSVEFVEF